MEWRELRLLHPVYVALAREFVIDIPLSPDLEAGLDGVSEEAIQQGCQWFKTMDERIQVHQLRQFLQTTPLADNEILRVLLLRHLGKQQPTAVDRDKIDFLLVQFFSLASPSRLDDSDCNLAYVAQVMEPVLGAVDLKMPDWLKPVDEIIQSAKRCRRLSEFFNAHVLEQGRTLKVESKDKYFLPVAMLAFTRFSFLMRRVFFRLMHDDLNAILSGLHELESKGVTTLDCRRAHFSHQEPTERLRMICHSWRVMFHAEYSSGQPLKMLADLRVVIEEALVRASQSEANVSLQPAASSEQKVLDASVAAATPPSGSQAREFDIAAGLAHDEGDVV